MSVQRSPIQVKESTNSSVPLSATSNSLSCVSLCRLLSASLGAALIYLQEHSQLYQKVDHQLHRQIHLFL